MTTPAGDGRDEEAAFRSLAAPGLDEDDLYAAMVGLPVPGGLWGEGRPWAPRPVDPPWDEATERRRRHDELMRKWPDEKPPPPRAASVEEGSWPAASGGPRGLSKNKGR